MNMAAHERRAGRRFTPLQQGGDSVFTRRRLLFTRGHRAPAMPSKAAQQAAELRLGGLGPAHKVLEDTAVTDADPNAVTVDVKPKEVNLEQHSLLKPDSTSPATRRCMYQGLCLMLTIGIVALFAVMLGEPVDKHVAPPLSNPPAAAILSPPPSAVPSPSTTSLAVTVPADTVRTTGWGARLLTSTRSSPP